MQKLKSGHDSLEDQAETGRLRSILETGKMPILRNLTATSRLQKAVTSPRTPKRSGASFRITSRVVIWKLRLQARSG